MNLHVFMELFSIFQILSGSLLIQLYVTISGVEEGIEFINDRSKPLTAYIFSCHRKNINKFLKETFSGGVAINDVIMVSYTL